ncbi:MAG TPA: hypothetical protein VGM53_28775 [Streptosporangiaceae bacterium]
MNHHEHPDDSVLTRQLRDSLTELAAPGPPPLAAITSRGRAHQRRRRAGFAAFGGASVAASGALALGLIGVLSAAPAVGTGTIGTPAPTRSTGTIQTAAFTLTGNADGTSTLTLTRGQLLDPVALQQALARHGIRALVKVGSYCWSSPAAPDPRSVGVLSIRLHVQLPAGPGPVPGGGPEPGDDRLGADTKTLINPAAMPSGTELFFGYFNSDHELWFDLIYAKSYTCGSGQQPPATP